MDSAKMSYAELQDVIRSHITAARNGKPYNRTALLDALREFERREAAIRKHAS